MDFQCTVASNYKLDYGLQLDIQCYMERMCLDKDRYTFDFDKRDYLDNLKIQCIQDGMLVGYHNSQEDKSKLLDCQLLYTVRRLRMVMVCMDFGQFLRFVERQRWVCIADVHPLPFRLDRYTLADDYKHCKWHLEHRCQHKDRHICFVCKLCHVGNRYSKRTQVDTKYMGHHANQANMNKIRHHIELTVHKGWDYICLEEVHLVLLFFFFLINEKERGVK